MPRVDLLQMSFSTHAPTAQFELRVSYTVANTGYTRDAPFVVIRSLRRNLLEVAMSATSFCLHSHTEESDARYSIQNAGGQAKQTHCRIEVFPPLVSSDEMKRRFNIH